MGRALCFSLVLVVSIQSLAADLRVDYELVEMSHVVDENTIYWPGNPPLNLTQTKALEAFGPGSWVETKKLCSAEHGGTHLDAPYHFNQIGAKVADIPLKNLISKAVVINITYRTSRDRDTHLTVDDILGWEKKYGKIPDGALILMNSGWHKKYPNRTDVFSTRENNASKFHFPGVHPDAVDWLLRNRPKINGIGVDTPSTDFGQSKDFQTHRKLAAGGKYGLAFVANLDAIPESGATIYALPYKLANGTGAPVHIIATWPKNGKKLDDFASYVDLTHPVGLNSIHWVGNPSFTLRALRADTNNGYWYASNEFCGAEHHGTHLDAPRHFSKNGRTVAEIPVNRLVGPAVVIDISKRAEKNRDATLEVNDLIAWEARHGRIPNGAIVLMNSGWTRKHPNKLQVFGTLESNTSLFHFPGFSDAASSWLVTNRPNITAIGVDTPSLDAAQSVGARTHRNVLELGIYGLENVANLNLLPESGATLIVLAYRLAKGTGAPTYVVGKIPYVVSGSSHLCSISWLHVIVLIQALLLSRLL